MVASIEEVVTRKARDIVSLAFLNYVIDGTIEGQVDKERKSLGNKVLDTYYKERNVTKKLMAVRYKLDRYFSSGIGGFFDYTKLVKLEEAYKRKLKEYCTQKDVLADKLELIYKNLK